MCFVNWQCSLLSRYCLNELLPLKLSVDIVESAWVKSILAVIATALVENEC